MTSLLRAAVLVLMVGSFAVFALVFFNIVLRFTGTRRSSAQSLQISAVAMVAAVLVGSAATAWLGMT